MIFLPPPFLPHAIPRTLAKPGDIFGCCDREGRGSDRILASRGWRPGMLVNILPWDADISPSVKIYPAPNDSEGVQKPWCRTMDFQFSFLSPEDEHLTLSTTLPSWASFITQTPSKGGAVKAIIATRKTQVFPLSIYESQVLLLDEFCYWMNETLWMDGYWIEGFQSHT